VFRQFTVLRLMQWQRTSIFLCLETISLCPPGMIYQCSVSACLATCADPTAPQFCPFPNKDACVCPTGQLLHNGTCTANCPIGCVDANNQLHPVGDMTMIPLLLCSLVFLLITFVRNVHWNSSSLLFSHLIFSYVNCFCHSQFILRKSLLFSLFEIQLTMVYKCNKSTVDISI